MPDPFHTRIHPFRSRMLSGPVSASSASLLSYLNTLVQVCPKSKHSKSVIAQAIALGVVGLYLYNNLVPPAKLRQYPSINPFKYLYHILTGTDGFRYARDLVVPVVRDRKAKAYVVSCKVALYSGYICFNHLKDQVSILLDRQYCGSGSSKGPADEIR